jgi:(2R)-3-sulfolactate dehydrogenase (NADP+)
VARVALLPHDPFVPFEDRITVPVDDGFEDVARTTLSTLCVAALVRAGASRTVASLLTEAALFAEDHGFSTVGVSHVLDYVSAMADGRLDGMAVPELSQPAPALVVADARGGVFHTAFDGGFDRLVEGARSNGVMVLLQRGAYAGGQLGWFTDRVARQGLLSLAAINSSPLLSTGPGIGRVFGTNPMAYSVPRATEPPVTVDQASSATAFASVREAAMHGSSLPDGWALDADLRPTNDPTQALDGAMLPFGGYKGANIAWFVELFASLGGGSWSLDAPDAFGGVRSPSVGMFLLAIDPSVVDPDYVIRVQQHVDRLAGLGVRRPGMALSHDLAEVRVRSDVLKKLMHR